MKTYSERLSEMRRRGYKPIGTVNIKSILSCGHPGNMLVVWRGGAVNSSVCKVCWEAIAEPSQKTA